MNKKLIYNNNIYIYYKKRMDAKLKITKKK